MVKDKHLFVVIHGLFGNPEHMLCLKKEILTRFDHSSDVELLVPETNGGLKSFDGVQLSAQRILDEMTDFIEKRAPHVRFTRISIVGYSLGGLNARYLIGLLEKIHFFDTVKPVFFTTFATPHVGSIFHSDDYLSRLLNLAGSNSLGVSGNDLFATNSTILHDLADPEQPFFQGLQRFENLILFANALHDRTVPFYTAYITNKDPFQDRHLIDLNYSRHVDGDDDTPFFVDMDKSRYVPSDDKPTSPPITAKERQFQLYALMALPIVLPIVVGVTTVSTVLSHMRYREARDANIINNTSRLESTLRRIESGDIAVELEDTDTDTVESKQSSPSEGIASMVGSAVDNVIAPAVDEVEHEASEEPSTTGSSITLKQLHVAPALGDGYKGLIDSTPKTLHLSEETQNQINQLNTLPWEKYTINLARMHSHAEIVNRRNKPGQGEQLMRFWVNLVADRLSETHRPSYKL